LADALLSGAVGELFAGALRRADTSGRGLRLRLSLGTAPELLDVPWELLYRRPTFLASQRRTPIVRFLEVGEEAPRQRIEGVVRILGVIANPRDLERLDVADERRRLERVLAAMLADGLVELDWLDPATPQELRRTLRDGNYHVLHFIGHGGTRGDDSVLVLEDAEGASAPLSRTALVNLFADQRSLCLAVLNSCRALGRRSRIRSPASPRRSWRSGSAPSWRCSSRSATPPRSPSPRSSRRR
jgi:CHAT domain